MRQWNRCLPVCTPINGEGSFATAIPADRNSAQTGPDADAVPRRVLGPSVGTPAWPMAAAACMAARAPDPAPKKAAGARDGPTGSMAAGLGSRKCGSSSNGCCGWPSGRCVSRSALARDCARKDCQGPSGGRCWSWRHRSGVGYAATGTRTCNIHSVAIGPEERSMLSRVSGCILDIMVPHHGVLVQLSDRSTANRNAFPMPSS